MITLGIDNEALALNRARIEYLAERVEEAEEHLQDFAKQLTAAYEERQVILTGGEDAQDEDGSWI